MSEEKRPLTVTIVRAPMGGYSVYDGRSDESPLLMSKTTLLEVSHALGDMVAMYFAPAAPADDDVITTLPRVMKGSIDEASDNIVRPSFFKRIMGG